MDSNRATKRRKLDSPSPNPIPSRESSPSSTIHVASASQINGAKSTQELWKEAKARKIPATQRKRDAQAAAAAAGSGAADGSVDRKAVNGVASTPAKRKPKAVNGTGTAKKKKATLDPLRNQKGAGSTTPKKAAGGGGSLGFFKQFHEKGASAASSPVKGTAGGLGDDRRTQQALDGQLGVDGGRTRMNGNGSVGTPAKKVKTFEDEIKELEMQARRDAAAEGAKNDQLDLGRDGRGSGRKSAVMRVDSLPEESPFYRSGRKPQQKAVPTTEVRLNEDANRDQDVMEIDESDHEAQIQQPEVQIPAPKPTPTQQEWTLTKGRPYAPVARSKDDSGAQLQPEDVAFLQRVLLDKITRRRPIPLTNLEDEYAKVSTVISQTITAGESNSMLVIGARGSGKTTMVDEILRKNSVEHPDDFLVVRLDGFIHTDDKIALREIWRQLGRGMELDEEEMATKSYADTMATLLALLSHPAEQGREEQADQVTKSVIFIMDEFDLFATHPRQTLLYNLFDIAQSRKAPIAVLGLTTCVDVSESLEKRVKSRFSHRYVHLGLPRSFAMFQGVCRAAINILPDDLTEDEKLDPVDHSQSLAIWSALVDDLLNNESIATQLRRIYYTTKSIPDFLNSLHLPLATLATPTAPITSNTLLAHLTTPTSITALPGPPDSKLSLLSNLSTLHTALLISASRLQTLYNTPQVSFALAYEEYKVLASKMKVAASASGALAQGAGGRVWGKAVSRGVWEELGECGLVLMSGGNGRVDVGLEEIVSCPGLELGSWGRWCKEI